MTVEDTQWRKSNKQTRQPSTQLLIKIQGRLEQNDASITHSPSTIHLQLQTFSMTITDIWKGNDPIRAESCGTEDKRPCLKSAIIGQVNELEMRIGIEEREREKKSSRLLSKVARLITETNEWLTTTFTKYMAKVYEEALPLVNTG